MQSQASPLSTCSNLLVGFASAMERGADWLRDDFQIGVGRVDVKWVGG